MDLVGAYATVLEILEASGPLPDGELVRRLREAGLSEAEVREVVEHPSEMTVHLADHGWASLPSLLAPRQLTHRLSPAEVALDTVCVDIDWLAAVPVLDAIELLADGTEFYVAEVEDVVDELLERDGNAVSDLPSLEVLVLPVGYLAHVGASAGGLLCLRFSADGPELAAIADSQVGDGRRLADAITPVLGPEPIDGDLMVWDLLAADPALLTRSEPPISAVLDEIGVSRHHALVAASGTDIEGLLHRRRVEGIARRHRLSLRDAEGVLTLVEHHEFLAYLLRMAADDPDAKDPDPDLDDLGTDDQDHAVSEEPIDRAGREGLDSHREAVRAAAAVLAHPAAAEALLGETVGIGIEGLAALGVLAEGLEPRAPRAAQASLRWLRAKANERLGHVLEAEEDLRAALALDPDHPLVLEDLGGFMSDRGDAEHALRLLRRAGVPADDDLLVVLEEHRSKAPASVGRNDPCWCGSGRKRKQCHRDGAPSLPLARRTTWMLAKTAQFLQEGPHRGLLLELAIARTDDLPDGALLRALGEPLVHDVALVEGGLYRDFLRCRGPLLPDEELIAFQQWALVERSLFDVEAVDPGHSLVLRDVRTGDRVTVTEHTASLDLTGGELICTRVVPIGAEHQIVGGIEPVSLGQREALIELLDDPDPVELISFLSARFAPPRIQNTEGEDLVDCRITVRVPDPAVLAARLDDRLDRDDDQGGDDQGGDDQGGGHGSSAWTETVVTMGMPRIRSQVKLDGDVATITANSDERADRTLLLLLELAPDAEVLTDERTPLGRDLDQALAASSPGAAGSERLDPGDPMVQQVVNEFIRQSEDAWVDEPIPALGGITPRDAVADPTRRDDVVRLLDSFPKVPPGGVGMDPDRLRRLLDLS